eukprot:588377-Pelagomonas_calceolata.AAC.1
MQLSSNTLAPPGGILIYLLHTFISAQLAQKPMQLSPNTLAPPGGLGSRHRIRPVAAGPLAPLPTPSRAVKAIIAQELVHCGCKRQPGFALTTLSGAYKQVKAILAPIPVHCGCKQQPEFALSTLSGAHCKQDPAHTCTMAAVDAHSNAARGCTMAAIDAHSIDVYTL